MSLQSLIKKASPQLKRRFFSLEKPYGGDNFKQNILPIKVNLATKITIGRVISGPILMIFVFYGYHKTSLSLLLLVAFSDAIDGFLARAFNQRTWLGSFLDPLADKLFLISAFIAYTFFEKSYYRLPMWLTVTVFFRDVLIMSGCLFFEIAHGKLKYEPITVSKWATFFQVICVLCVSVGNALFINKHTPYLELLIEIITTITLFLTVVSGIIYFKIALGLLTELSEKRNSKNTDASKRN